jgi:hypothetical protein
VLCFVLCAHRIYAGKYISGAVQIILGVAVFLWFKSACGELLAMMNSGSLDIDSVGRITEWEQTHLSQLLPPLAALIVLGVWVAADAGMLLAGKFTDGEGRRITKWM